MQSGATPERGYLLTMRRTLLYSALISGGVSFGGCAANTAAGQAPMKTTPANSSPEPVAVRGSDSTTWLVSDTAAKTAELSFTVTRPAGAEAALLNGYGRGEARIIVPVGWTVRWNWRNADSTSAHSLLLMRERERVPLEGGEPAFTNARTRMVTEGIPAGQTDATTFTAEEGGWYWLLCGVYSHGINGEWLELRVDPEAKTADVKVKGVNSEQ
jgi:Sulfocyanin (SoxE) domain